jgi:F0F1-type ATP synthase assembly protein I
MPPARPVSPFAFAVLGMEMAGFTVAGVLIDWLTGLLPWFTITLTLLGVVVAFLHLARTVRPGSPSKSEGDGS